MSHALAVQICGAHHEPLERDVVDVDTQCGEMSVQLRKTLEHQTLHQHALGANAWRGKTNAVAVAVAADRSQQCGPHTPLKAHCKNAMVGVEPTKQRLREVVRREDDVDQGAEDPKRVLLLVVEEKVGLAEWERVQKRMRRWWV